MRRSKTKSPRAGDKEKVELPPAGDHTSKKKVIKVKRVYECKTCRLQFDTRLQALSHVCRHKRIRA
jgi:hypothetical protein